MAYLAINHSCTLKEGDVNFRSVGICNKPLQITNIYIYIYKRKTITHTEQSGYSKLMDSV